MRLSSIDPEIRSYTLKAEKYLLLVESAKFNKFVSRLKSYGYLFSATSK